MTVLLIGVGADEEHLEPAPKIDSEGRYEYIPIPETWLTSETRTYGNLELEHHEVSASAIVDKIRPKGEDGEWVTDQKIVERHPLHYDPDFTAQTFGDSRSSGVGSTLSRELSEGDILGFYTGLRSKDGNLNRYIYGYFTVAEVADLSALDDDEYYDRLRDYPENAHAKRLIQTGKPKHDDLVIIDGCDPGELLTEPIKITKRLDTAPWYELTEEFVDKFNVKNGQIAVSRKPALTLRLSPDEFIQRIQS